MNFTYNRQNVCGITVCTLLSSLSRVATGIRQFRITQTFASRLGGLQSSRCPCADDFPLVLGHSRQDMDGQLVGMRIIDSNELHTGIHQRCDKRQVSGLILTPILYMWTTDLHLLLLVTAVNGFFTLRQYSWMSVWLPELFPTRLRATGIAFTFNAQGQDAAGLRTRHHRRCDRIGCGLL